MDTEPDADDLWDSFYRPKSLRSVNPPVFVPASASYSTRGDDDDEYNNQEGNDDDVATWYRSLPRQTTNPHNSSAPTESLEARPEPIQPTPPTLRRSHDWFISRAISQPNASTSAPHPSSSGSSSTLADLLSRNPPTAAQPFRPPVFLHLGPSNKGWVMLQNQGWSEGEGLGNSARRSRGACPMNSLSNKKKGRGSPPSVLPSPPSYQEQRTSEVLLEDDIVEVQNGVPVIDLTLSDSEHEDEDDDDGNNDNVPPSPPSDPRAESTVLLTPLPTVLKSDRLGIGLKAKTEGPYRSSVKRVTPSAAALAAHTKASEDLRRTQDRFGKGRRAYARAERLEREHRQHLMAYLSEP